MRIHIGTENQAKIDAVQEALRLYPQFALADVLPVRVDSGVSSQPTSMEETIQGACARAQKAFANCSLSVGIESGFMSVPAASSGYMEFTACAIFNGKDVHLGFSPAFECPPEVTSLVIEKKMELTEAVNQLGLVQDRFLGQKEGYIGLLTKSRVTRKDYTKQAVLMALIHVLEK